MWSPASEVYRLSLATVVEHFTLTGTTITGFTLQLSRFECLSLSTFYRSPQVRYGATRFHKRDHSTGYTE